MSDQLTRNLLYVTDPMCSWCWGFAPVIEQIRLLYENRVHFKILVGGLRPGNTERFDEYRRNTILGHWKAVHERTGQVFNFAFHMGPDFTYDTEPPARAMLGVRRLCPSLEFQFLKDIHEALYVKNLNVVQESVLVDLAKNVGVDQVQFKQMFQDAELKKEVWEEFDRSRRLGVSGFPTLLAESGGEFTTLTHGYQSLETLVPEIETWLNLTNVRKV